MTMLLISYLLVSITKVTRQSITITKSAYQRYFHNWQKKNTLELSANYHKGTILKVAKPASQ